MLESVKLAIAMAIALTFCTPCSSGFADGFVEIETEDLSHGIILKNSRNFWLK